MISLVLLLASFDAQGFAFSPFEGDEQPAQLLALDDNDQLVVVGRTWGASTSSMLALRFNGQGEALGEPLLLAPGSASSGAFGAAVDADGRIVVAGYGFGDHGQGLAMDAVLTRIDENGALDTSFAGGGIALVDVHGFDDHIASIALLDDGRIIGVGRTTLGFEGGVVTTHAAAWLFDANGALLDTLTFAVEGEQDDLVAVALDPQGRVIAAGNAVYDAGGRASVVSARLVVDGTALVLDNTWSDDGVGLHDPGAFFASAALTVHARSGDGGMFIGATVDNGAADPDFDLAWLALDDDGALVRTTSASVHTLKGDPDPTRDNLRATTILDDGTAVLLGDSDGRLVMVRVLGDGTLVDELIEIAPCGVSARGASVVPRDGGVVVAAGCFLDPFYADLVLANVRLDDIPPSEGEGEGEGEGGEGEGEGTPQQPTDPTQPQPHPQPKPADGADGADGAGCGCAAGEVGALGDATLWALVGLALVSRRARRPTA